MKVEEVLKEGFNYFKNQWITLLIATIIALIGSILIITIPPLFFGIYYMGLKIVRSEEVEISDVFKGFDYFITSWIMFIVGGFAVLLGLIALVIPGLLLLILFQYAIPIAIKDGKGAVESLQESFNIGKGNFGFSIILGIALQVINAIGSEIYVGWLITYPFTVICLCLATLKLTENKSQAQT